MAALDRNQTRLAFRGGVVAGIVGGFALSLFTLLMSLMSGRDIWKGMKVAGAPFTGERAMDPGFDAATVVVGLLSHFAVSIVWAVLFALVFFGLTKVGTLFAGVFWGFIAWITMFYVVLPMVRMGDITRSTPVSLAILEHVLFGVVVAAAFLPFQRPQPGGRWPESVRPGA
jgi:hypothetical protein